MHTLLLLSSLLLAVLGGYLASGLLRRVGGWHRRRGVQVAALVAPLVSLGVGLGGLYHFAGRPCLLGAASWDVALARAVPLGMGLVALGALALGLLRLVLLNRVVARRSVVAPAEFQAVVARLADQLGGQRPRVLLCVYDRPLALVCGLWRPTVLVSTWMVERLDRRELESVLAHELAHVARRDYPLVWLATTLRDAFFYLPTSWAVYRQLQHEKELACDDLAVRATNRPLALASALAKVWQDAVSGPRLEGAQLLVGTGGPPIEGRIERLLAPPGPSGNADSRHARPVVRNLGGAALATFLAFEGVNLAIMLAPMGCGPAAALGRLWW